VATTFVTLDRTDPSESKGFWMQDWCLELWLRLLALHLPEPTDSGEHAATTMIRDQWLSSSKGCCIGGVLEDAGATPEGRDVVRIAVNSLLVDLNRQSAPLDPATLNLLGMEGSWGEPVDRQPLREVGQAFLDLLDGKIKTGPSSVEIMPGLKPYPPSA